RIERPLLGVTRAQTGAYCRAHGFKYRDDPSNENPRYRRSRVRHELVPALRCTAPGAEETLLRLAQHAAETVEALNAELKRLWPGVTEPRGAELCLRLQPFARVPDALHPHLLARTVGDINATAEMK